MHQSAAVLWGNCQLDFEIEAADVGAMFRKFVDVPYLVQANNKQWAPLLRIQQLELLDRKKHPFFKHAEIRLFVALSGGRAVGRIAAINDAVHNGVHGETTTHFGFFECIDSPAIASALFAKVEQAAREWGHNIVRGPFNPSVNEEIGLQIDAFDTPNFIMIPGNPAYYAPLVEQAGYAKCMDLFCYRMQNGQMSEKLLSASPTIEKRLNIRIRKIDRKNVEADAMKIWKVYNAAWEKNWYWVPASREEFEILVKNLKQIADLDLIFLAEKADGELVGFTVAVPNLNEAMIKVRNGRLFPFGLLKILWLSRPGAIKSIRVMVMGVLEAYRGRGIDAVMYAHQYQEAQRKGYQSAEMSQILETNTMMNRAAVQMGGKRYKTHRMYEKSLA